LVRLDKFHHRDAAIWGRDTYFAVEFVEWSAGVCHRIILNEEIYD